MRMNPFVNAPQCVEDWKLRNGGSKGVISDDFPGDLRICGWCGKPTRSGIFVRAKFDDLLYPPPIASEPISYRVWISDDGEPSRVLVDTTNLEAALAVYDAILAMVTGPGNKREGDAVALMFCQGDQQVRRYERDAA